MVDELITFAPGRLDLPLDLDEPFPDTVSAGTAHSVLERMEVMAVLDGTQARWMEMRCFEIVTMEIAVREFGGEDPLRRQTRNLLVKIRRRLFALATQLEAYAGDIELLEPDSEDVELLRKMMTRRPGG